MRSEENKLLVKQFMQHLCDGNVEAFIEMYHPQGSVWTSGTTLISGTFDRNQIEAAGKSIFEAFPHGLQFTITGMTAEGDKVAVEAASEGKHISGQEYRNLYHLLFEFKDGQIIQLKEYMDTEKVTDILCGGQRPQ